MGQFTRIGYVLLCLLAPAAWGLLVERVFHLARTRRTGGQGPDRPESRTPQADQRSDG